MNTLYKIKIKYAFRVLTVLVFVFLVGLIVTTFLSNTTHNISWLSIFSLAYQVPCFWYSFSAATRIDTIHINQWNDRASQKEER